MASQGEVLDPRKALMISYYKDPLSDTFGDVKHSCLKAGFSPSYSANITGKNAEWLAKAIQADVELIKRAEDNLRHFASMPCDLNTKLGIEKAKMKLDVSKFIAKTLARKKYAEDQEADRPPINVNIINYKGNAPIATGEVIDIRPIDNAPIMLPENPASNN